MENENSEEGDGGPSPKQPKLSYSNTVLRMMKNMGYQDDKGLGKQNQGRLEPVEAVQTDGRRGLGSSKAPDQDGATELAVAEQWNTIEVLQLPEPISWIADVNRSSYTLDELQDMLRMGTRKDTLVGETLFCEPDVLAEILEAKTAFDIIDDHDLRRARSRSNPFETIRSSIFLNRAAVKMANIDSMCDFMFTKPRDRHNRTLLGDNELLYFADICAGPGGFSEYILYRKAWEAKGFGLTLRGANDFKLDKFFAGSPESFDPYYGVHDDGNVFDESNQDSFRDYIHKHCSVGVHFVMADGGFSVEGQKNIQEILSKQLYLCQCITALKILRVDGSFVCKLFDLFTPFSMGLVYLLYRCFEQIAIIKPNSSRPANSERYMVCRWKRSDTHTAPICDYLNCVNRLLNDPNGDDVLEIVPVELLLADKTFSDYMIESNNTIGRNQVIGLRKIIAFHENPKLKETRQSETRTRCLKLWNLPDKLRQAPEVKSTDKLLEEMLDNWYEDKDKTLFSMMPVELDATDLLQKHVESIYDWHFVPIGRGETNINSCSIFLCKSKGNLLRYTGNRRWEPVDQYIFEISARSLFYGEIVYEYNGEGRTQTRICGLHIIDAIMLGGVSIRKLKLTERLNMAQKYALSLNKPHKAGNTLPPIRSKTLFHLQDLNVFFNQMRYYTLKDSSLSRLGFSLNSEQKFFVPGGILLLCEITQCFFSRMSKSHNALYYYDKSNNMSHYTERMPADFQNRLYASFRNSFQRRLLWKWTNIKQVEEASDKDNCNLLYRDDLQKFLMQKLIS